MFRYKSYLSSSRYFHTLCSVYLGIWFNIFNIEGDTTCEWALLQIFHFTLRIIIFLFVCWFFPPPYFPPPYLSSVSSIHFALACCCSHIALLGPGFVWNCRDCTFVCMCQNQAHLHIKGLQRKQGPTSAPWYESPLSNPHTRTHTEASPVVSCSNSVEHGRAALSILHIVWLDLSLPQHSNSDAAGFCLCIYCTVYVLSFYSRCNKRMCDC